MGDNNPTYKLRSAARGAVFFTKIGQLKLRSELREKIEQGISSTAASRSEVVGSSMSKVENRFRTEVASAANEINRRASQLKQSKENLKAERVLLQNLKQAFESGDEAGLLEIKEDLQGFRQKLEESAAQIVREQGPSTSARVIHLDEKEGIRVEIPELSLLNAENDLPQNAEETKSQLKRVEDALVVVGEQNLALVEVRKVLATALNSGRKQLSESSQSSIKSIDSAQMSANEISSEIKSLSADDLISRVAPRIDPVLASLLLKT